MPEMEPRRSRPGEVRRHDVPAPTTRRRKARAAGLADLPVSALAVIPIWFQSVLYSNYGWMLFVGVPLLLGFLSAILLGFDRRRAWRDTVGTSMLALLYVGIVMLVGYFEGVFCLLMALPISVPLVIVGASIGVGVLDALRDRRRIPVSLAILLPFALSAVQIPVEPEGRTITTVRTLDAPPERVWPLLFNLPSIPPPTSPIFRFGLAHPVATRSRANRRECVLTTGTMPEKIVVNEMNRRLRFDVLSTPPSLREWNPFGSVEARHLTETFTCEWGEFRLTPLAGGRTRVEATTRYHHQYAPGPYWSLWTDATVRGVHAQVLDEISRRLAER